jgi:hypothetical protein
MYDKLGVSSRVELLLCALADPAYECAATDALTVESASRAMDSCSSAAKRFAKSQCIIRNACRARATDAEDRISALTWTLMTKRLCETVSEHALVAEREITKQLTDQERAEALRRSQKWFSDQQDTLTTFLPERLAQR